MRWIVAAVTAAVLTLTAGGVARACGGCCSRGGGACPSCPSGTSRGAEPSCPTCPQDSSHGAYRYWNNSYGRYLVFDPATRRSYYWSEPHRSYVAVPPTPPAGTAPAPQTTVTYSPHAAAVLREGTVPRAAAAPYGGQKTCPVTGDELGSMGSPIPVTVRGQTVYVCCRGCVARLQREPDMYLRRVDAERARRQPG